MNTNMNHWKFPLRNWSGEIPTSPHPGAFGAKRKHDYHTGVDLYVPGNEPVYAVEDGIVISIENYTGPQAGSPWWLPTKAVLVKGKSGVVCYGEVRPKLLWPGESIGQGQMFAQVVPVLKEGKVRKDIPGHSRFMLHFELYNHETTKSVWWRLNQEKPEGLLNPTLLLKNSLKEI